jgi:hypothetical protein
MIMEIEDYNRVRKLTYVKVAIDVLESVFLVDESEVEIGKIIKMLEAIEDKMLEEIDNM